MYILNNIKTALEDKTKQEHGEEIGLVRIARTIDGSLPWSTDKINCVGALRKLAEFVLE